MSKNAIVSPWKLIWEGWVRHTVGVIGAALFARGYLSSSDQVGWIQTASTEIIGASGVVFAYVWVGDR